MLLSSKGEMTPSSLPKSKMKRPETEAYVRWVIEEIRKDRASFNEFGRGKGIIATREKFLKFLKTQQGMEQLKNGNGEYAASVAATDKFSKTIIVPVAIPGCGAPNSFAYSSPFSFRNR